MLCQVCCEHREGGARYTCACLQQYRGPYPEACHQRVCYITFVLVLSNSRSEAVWRTGVWAKGACCAEPFRRLSRPLREVRAWQVREPAWQDDTSLIHLLLHFNVQSPAHGPCAWARGQKGSPASLTLGLRYVCSRFGEALGTIGNAALADWMSIIWTCASRPAV